MLHIRLQFYGHLAFFNLFVRLFVCFSCQVFPWATDAISYSAVALFLTDTLQIVWVTFQRKLSHLSTK